MSRIVAFYEDVKKEMSKVSWPTTLELRDSSMVVVVFSVLLSIFIFGVDQVYSTVLEFVYGINR
jgi:preprotein translocase subunit SecE